MPCDKLLILGGGVAGLAASYCLTKAGYDVTLVEGRDRLGGRIYTQKLPSGQPIELGANWREAGVGNPIVDFDFGLQFKKSSYLKTIFYEDKCKMAHLIKLLQLAEEIILDIREHTHEYADPAQITMAQAYEDSVARKRAVVLSSLSCVSNWLKKKTPLLKPDIHSLNAEELAQLRKLFAAYKGPVEGLGLDKISVVEYLQSRSIVGYNLPQLDAGLRKDGTPYLVTNGYEKLWQGLEALCHTNPGNFTVLMQHKVTYINTEGDKPEITCQTPDSEVRLITDNVICTLPLGVMQRLITEHRISPSLPSLQKNALMSMRMGVLNKVFLQFDQCFWGKDKDKNYIVLAGEDDNKHIALVNLENVHPGSNTLVAHYYGDCACFCAEKDDQSIVDATMEKVKAVYGAALPKPCYTHVTRWHEDEFALGSYFTFGLGMAADAQFQASQSLPDRHLWFAGEHLSHYHGTVHGAFISAQQAAESYQARVDAKFMMAKCHEAMNDDHLVHLQFLLRVAGEDERNR